MDLIATLSSQLGIDPEKSQGLAGTALGMLQTQVAQKLGAGDAEALAVQVPELSQWQATAAKLGFGGTSADGPGGLLGGGGLLGAAASLLGGGSGLDLGALAQVVSKAGLGPTALQQLLPSVLDFLKSRLDPALLSKILGAIPALKGSRGGLAGALGGILGG